MSGSMRADGGVTGLGLDPRVRGGRTNGRGGRGKGSGVVPCGGWSTPVLHLQGRERPPSDPSTPPNASGGLPSLDFRRHRDPSDTLTAPPIHPRTRAYTSHAMPRPRRHPKGVPPVSVLCPSSSILIQGTTTFNRLIDVGNPRRTNPRI